MVVHDGAVPRVTALLAGLSVACGSPCGSEPATGVVDTFSAPPGTSEARLDEAASVLQRRAELAGACARVRREGATLRAHRWQLAEGSAVPAWIVPGRLVLAPATPADAVVATVAEGRAVWVEPEARVRWVVDTAAALSPLVRSATLEDGPNGAYVSVEFDDAGRAAFAAFSRAHVGEVVVIAVDQVVLLAPIIREPIPGGRVQVMCRAGCGDLAATLAGGALPVALTWESQLVVGPP